MDFASQTLIRLTIDQMHEGIQVVDFDWKYVYLNAAAIRHSNKAAEELLGHAMPEVYPGINRTVIYSALKDVMEARCHRRVESEFAYPDGKKCWFELFIEPHPNGILIRSIDITQRKKIEEQYLYSQKLEAVGRLAGGIAHDFNNKLGIMMLYCEMALDAKLPEELGVTGYIENILKAINESAIITKQLLAFGRKQVLDMRIYDLNDILSSSTLNLKKLIGENIEVKYFLEPNLWRSRVDRSQIEQVVLNLVLNSRDSIAANGNITIETANTELDKSYASLHDNVIPGEYVMLSVSDNGAGMSAETRGKVFEPFFTTKEFGKSSGLGLASVHGIVNQSNGHIWVYSEAGIGTTFKIYLPRASETAEPSLLANPTIQVKSKGERILLVEDDALLREAFFQTLRAAGYFVLSADSAEAAIEIFNQHQGDFDLLLTDVVLPKMSGRDLAALLVEKKPDLKFAFMSGYTENSIVHNGVLDTDSVLIQKPIATKKLLAALRGVLDLNLKKGLI